MNNDMEKAKKVIKDCVGCGSEDVDNCKSINNNLISDCIGAIVPTDEELALLAGQEMIDFLKLRILDLKTKHQ